MISPIANLYEVQFPIYVTTPDNLVVVDFSIDKNIKYLVLADARRIPYDMILQEYSTYLGRLMVLNRLELENVITFDYSFTNLAHLIYARPKFDKNSLIVDNLGQVKRLNSIYGEGLCARYSHRKGSYIFSKAIPSPMQIPQFPLLLDSLETYKPNLELVKYFNTYYFKNILEKGINPKKTWKIQIM